MNPSRAYLDTAWRGAMGILDAILEGHFAELTEDEIAPSVEIACETLRANLAKVKAED